MSGVWAVMSQLNVRLKEIAACEAEIERIRAELHSAFCTDISEKCFEGHEFDGFWPALKDYADAYWGGFSDENFKAFRELLEMEEFTAFQREKYTVDNRLIIVHFLDDLMKLTRKKEV
jgi:hypothetical protein